MFTTLRAAGLLCGLFSLTHDSRELPVLAPAEGSSATRTVEVDFELELLSVTMQQGDQTQEIDVEQTQTYRQTWTATDTFGKSEDGRIRRLQRTYGDMAASMTNTSPEGDDSQEEASELDGKQVVFLWDAEAGEYRTEWAEGSEGDEVLLEDLQCDLDLSYLLPTSELEVDETFTLEASAFSGVLDFGGELHFRGEDEDDEKSSQQQALEQSVDNLTGDLTGTFKGLVEEEGRRLYKLAFEFELVGNGEVSSEIEPPEDAPVAMSGEETVSAEMSWKGTAELVFDLESKRLHSFSMDAELGVQLENKASLDIEGQGQMEFMQTVVLEGPFAMKVAVE
jgi:hypothetical protein